MGNSKFHMNSGIYSRPPYTEYISTRWYRAPECLLTDGFYSYKMDLFAAGCVWFEVMALFPLFPGQNEMDQLQKIHSILGTPSEDVLRKFKLNSDVAFPDKKGSVFLLFSDQSLYRIITLY